TLAQREAKRGKPGRPPIDLYYEKTLAGFYELRKYAPAFTQGGRFTPAAKLAYEALTRSDEHALDPERYSPTRLQPLARAALDAESSAGATLQSDAAEMDLVARRLVEAECDRHAGDADDGVLDRLLADASPLPGVKQAFAGFSSQQSALQAQAVALEVL